jgi:RimJ/RimL family protein N-acetyltransferase
VNYFSHNFGLDIKAKFHLNQLESPVMIQKLLRSLTIIRSQAKRLHFSTLVLLFVESLFKVERILIFVKELNNASSLKDDSCDSMYVKKGEVNELKNIRKDMESPPWEFCLDIYDKITHFFIYQNNDGIIGHISWIYYKGNPNRFIELASDEAEIKYSLTIPKYRGRGLYPKTLAKIQTYLKGKEYKRVFICVDEKSYASIKGIQKASFKFIAKIKIVKFMGVQLNKKFSAYRRNEKNWT